MSVHLAFLTTLMVSIVLITNSMGQSTESPAGITGRESFFREAFLDARDKDHKEKMPKKTKKKVKNWGKPKPEDNDHDEEDVKVEYLDSPIKSKNDKNNYRVLKLPNEMVVLLVSSPAVALGQTDTMKFSTAAERDHAFKLYNADQKARCVVDQTIMEAETLIRRANICVTVGAGRFSDPRQIPGISLLISEVILHNSVKYPDKDDDFIQFLKDCRGKVRTFIGVDTTTFDINVPEDYFVEAIARSSNSFINLLVNRDDIDNLIHNSLRSGGCIDPLTGSFVKKWGKQHLFANLASARHPVKALGVDCYQGMGKLPTDQIAEEITKFRERHYSAQRMTLVLKASLPLDTLEEYAKKYFSKIVNNRMPPRDLSQYNFANSFGTPKSRRIYTMKPINDTDNYALELNWTLPPSHWLYRSKPRDYLAWLIKQAGEGSLVSHLRKENWCYEIIIGDNHEICRDSLQENSIYCLFSVKIQLTQEGHKNHKKILDCVFSYINMLRQAGPQERIFEELATIEKAKFRFSRNFEQAGFAKDLCINMHLYPPIDYLTGSSLYLEYDHVSLKTCMDLLTPGRATIVVYDKNFNNDKAEAMSNKEDCDQSPKMYASTEIPEDWINHWKIVEPMENFHLPKSNVFLSNDFTLIPTIKNPPRYPVKIYSDALSEIWYKPDTTFRLPYCCMNFHYVTPLAMAEPENAAMLDLFVEALRQVMLEELYPTAAAGLKYEIKACQKGLLVEAHGFNQKLPFLMKKISKYIADCPKLVTKNLFTRIKLLQEAKYRESLHNYDSLCEQLRLSIVRLVHWTCLDKQTALEGITFKHFQYFLERFADHVYLQCLVQGNISNASVIESTRECVQLSNCRALSPNTMPELRANELPRGHRCCRVKSFNSNFKVNMVKNYYQIGDATSHRLSVMIDLLIIMMNDPVLQLLGNRGPLSSIRLVAEKHNFGMLGYSLIAINENVKYHWHPLLGPKGIKDPGTIVDIDAHIENLRKILNMSVKEMSEGELLQLKSDLLFCKLLTDKNLLMEVTRNWIEITSGSYCFDRREQEFAALNAIGPDEIRKWLAHLTTGASKLRKLSIQVCGGENVARNATYSHIKQDKRNLDPGYRHVEHRLTYLTNLTTEKGEKRDDYITDIEDFKIGLQVLPIVRKSTLSTVTASPTRPSTTATTTTVTK